MQVGLVAFAAVVFAVCGLSVAHADEGKGRGACRADAEKFCKDVQPGEGRMAQCLARHESELSESCRGHMAAGRQRMEEVAEACRHDASQLCEGVQPGKGRLARCLASKKEQLSPGCSAEIGQMEERHPCMGDIARLCEGVEAGGGRLNQCLTDHEGELSGKCKAAMEKHMKRGKHRREHNS